MNDEIPRQRRQRHAALSEVLARIAADDTRQRVTVGDALALAGDRAFGALLFVFAVPNVVPTPPGTSSVLGLPLMLLAVQFLFGRKTPWLPHMIADRSVAREDFVRVLTKVNPRLQRLERVLKPRLGLLVSPIAERILGLVILALAILIFLPIPFGNIVPAAAICLMALALIEHDGLVAALGAAIGIASLLFLWVAIVAVVRAAIRTVEQLGWFGA